MGGSIRGTLLAKFRKVAELKAKNRWESSTSHARENGLLKRFKHRKVKIQETWARLKTAEKREKVLGELVTEESSRVARKLEELKSVMNVYSHMERKWASLTEMHNHALRFQAVLKVARRDVGKIAKNLPMQLPNPESWQLSGSGY